jgi:hypothetical protein
MIGFNFNKGMITDVEVRLIDKNLEELHFKPDNVSTYSNKFVMMLDLEECELSFEDSRDIRIAVVYQYDRKGSIIRMVIFELGDVDFGSIDKFLKFTYKIVSYKDFYLDNSDLNDVVQYLNSLRRDLKISRIIN